MTHSFDFTDEELSVLAYVLWEQDNNLATLPPGQFTEQAKQVRVVAKLAHEFDQRNREAGAAREQRLLTRLTDLVADTTSSSEGKSLAIAKAAVRIVRDHDNPPEPQPGYRSTAEQDAARRKNQEEFDRGGW